MRLIDADKLMQHVCLRKHMEGSCEGCQWYAGFCTCRNLTAGQIIEMIRELGGDDNGEN